MIDHKAFEFAELYMLVDILRQADDNGQLLLQLILAITTVSTNKSAISRRKLLLGLFADAFASRDDIDQVKALFQSKLIDPAYNESILFASYNALMICYECIQLSSDISLFFKALDISHDIGLTLYSDDDSYVSEIGELPGNPYLTSCPDILEVMRQPLSFDKCVHLVYKQSVSLDAFISPSHLHRHRFVSEMVTKTSKHSIFSSVEAGQTPTPSIILNKIYQNSKKIISELKTSFGLISQLQSLSEDVVHSDMQSIYAAYLHGMDLGSKVR